MFKLCTHICIIIFKSINLICKDFLEILFQFLNFLTYKPLPWNRRNINIEGRPYIISLIYSLSSIHRSHESSTNIPWGLISKAVTLKLAFPAILDIHRKVNNTVVWETNIFLGNLQILNIWKSVEIFYFHFRVTQYVGARSNPPLGETRFHSAYVKIYKNGPKYRQSLPAFTSLDIHCSTLQYYTISISHFLYFRHT